MKIILIILSIFLITGCKEEEKIEVIETIPKETKELIHIKEVKLNNNDVIYLVLNNSDKVVDIELNISYLDENGENIKYRTKTVDNFNPNSIQVVKGNNPLNYSEIYLIKDIYETDKEPLKKREIYIESKRLKNYINVKTTNKYLKTTLTKFLILYFYKGKITHYDTLYELIPKKEFKPFLIDTNNIKYDHYSIFII